MKAVLCSSFTGPGDLRLGDIDEPTPAADEILYEEVPAGRVGQHVLMQQGEMLRRHRLVVVPPDLAIGVFIADDELVTWRAACVLAGGGTEGALGCQFGLSPANRFLIEKSGGEVVTYAPYAAETDRRQLDCLVMNSERLHSFSLR